MTRVALVGIDYAGGLQLGHQCIDVFIDGTNPVLVGDHVQNHGHSPHDNPVMIEGSSNVFINGIPVCREGDHASCGHQTTASSTTVDVL